MPSKPLPEDDGPILDGNGPMFRGAGPKGEEGQPAAPRWAYGALVGVGGLAAVAFCFPAALSVFRNVAPAPDSATAVATVLAPVTGVVGTVVGAYFGIQAGSAGTAA